MSDYVTSIQMEENFSIYLKNGETFMRTGVAESVEARTHNTICLLPLVPLSQVEDNQGGRVCRRWTSGQLVPRRSCPCFVLGPSVFYKDEQYVVLLDLEYLRVPIDQPLYTHAGHLRIPRDRLVLIWETIENMCLLSSTSTETVTNKLAKMPCVETTGKLWFIEENGQIKLVLKVVDLGDGAPVCVIKVVTSFPLCDDTDGTLPVLDIRHPCDVRSIITTTVVPRHFTKYHQCANYIDFLLKGKYRNLKWFSPPMYLLEDGSFVINMDYFKLVYKTLWWAFHDLRSRACGYDFDYDYDSDRKDNNEDSGEDEDSDFCNHDDDDDSNGDNHGDDKDSNGDNHGDDEDSNGDNHGDDEESNGGNHVNDEDSNGDNHGDDEESNEGNHVNDEDSDGGNHGDDEDSNADEDNKQAVLTPEVIDNYIL